MPPIISIANLTKTYASGYQALKKIDLEIRKGEIFALLGPHGAGKTTLISVICGIVTPTEREFTPGGLKRSSSWQIPGTLKTQLFAGMSGI